MNKTKIDWCDYTWNPVTGCLHGCDFCYARRIAERFKCSTEVFLKKFRESQGVLPSCFKGIYNCTFPFGFNPTFYKERLDEPQKVKKPSKIFVVSMGDLFGDWVPDEWMEQVFEACAKAPQHKYLFLTKNPKMYAGAWFQDLINPIENIVWFGATVTTQKAMSDAAYTFCKIRAPINTFLSIEPIQEQIILPGTDCRWHEWVIIGAETGNRKGKIVPRREWIQRIVDDCRDARVPVFMKQNLQAAWGDELIREWPEGLKG